MVKPLKRTVFVGTYRHAVDAKNRVAIPAKWRAGASGASEFYVLPDSKNCLVVLSSATMDRILEKADEIKLGDDTQREALRTIASRAHGSPVDSQGRITLTEDLLKMAGITDEVVLVGTISRFEIWSPKRWEAADGSAMEKFSEAAKHMGL